MLSRRLYAQLACGIVLLVCGIIFVIPYNIPGHSSEVIDISMDGRINRNISAIVSIERAHSEGLSHRGIWLFVVDEREELLLLKRHARYVTCPDTWSAPGEHTKYLEPYVDTAYRGMSEELGLNRSKIISMQQLSPSPMWLHIKYDNMGRKTDVQWTSSFLVRINRHSIEGFNTESSLSAWVPLKEFEVWSNQNEDLFCKVPGFQYKEQLNGTTHETDFRSMLSMNVKLVKKLL